MDPKKRREFPIYQTHMAFLAVFAVVCLFSLYAPYSPEPHSVFEFRHQSVTPLSLKYRVC